MMFEVSRREMSIITLHFTKSLDFMRSESVSSNSVHPLRFAPSAVAARQTEESFLDSFAMVISGRRFGLINIYITRETGMLFGALDGEHHYGS
jgi:hypothetical protein